MKALTLALVLTVGSGMAHATMENMPDMANMDMPAAAKTATHQGTGIVKAIDEKTGKLQLAHQAIASLHWSAMTMWFGLKTPLPANLKVGDQVKFDLAQAGKNWVLVSIIAQ